MIASSGLRSVWVNHVRPTRPTSSRDVRFTFNRFRTLAPQRIDAVCRYCCKSPKLPGANFLAVKKSDRRPPIDVAPITLPRSPASLSSGNEVPHIFTRKSRVQPKEILITKTASHANLRRPLNILCASNAPASGQNEGAPEGNRSAPQFQGQSLRQRPWSVRPPAPCRNSRSGSSEASSPLGPRARGQRAGARLLNRRT
jgi:hypothetical protein